MFCLKLKLKIVIVDEASQQRIAREVVREEPDVFLKAE